MANAGRRGRWTWPRVKLQCKPGKVVKALREPGHAQGGEGGGGGSGGEGLAQKHFTVWREERGAMTDAYSLSLFFLMIFF